MAFTGTPTVKKISERKYRITGLSLAGAAAGAIGFSDKTVAPEVSLGPCPDWQPYSVDNTTVPLIDSVNVTMNPLTAVTTSVPVRVVKTGTTHGDFVITMTNDTAATASPQLDIYVEFH